ncbi:MAG: polyprenol monophosphomannose synthase [Elusimicrobiota bacterium]
MNSIIVIPTYNERENIKRLVEAVFALNLGLHILVVDDNSLDGTREIAQEFCRSNPDQFFLLERPAKLGLGSAYLDGFRYALSKNYDYIFEMDADFSHRPAYLPDFLKALEKYDVVVGSRYINHTVNVVNWPLKRLVISFLASKYVRLFLGLKIFDPTTGFKVFHRRVLEKINLDKVKSRGYSIQFEVIYRAAKNGFSLGEIPIVFYDRIDGYSKLYSRVVWEAVYMVWYLRIMSLLGRI